MPKRIQVEDKSSVKIGSLEFRNNTGNAIQILVGKDGITLDVVACCIGEEADH